MKERVRGGGAAMNKSQGGRGWKDGGGNSLQKRKKNSMSYEE